MKTSKTRTAKINKESLIKRYFKSREMVEFFCSENLFDPEIIDVILGSSDSLENKLHLMKSHFDNGENSKVRNSKNKADK